MGLLGKVRQGPLLGQHEAEAASHGLACGVLGQDHAHELVDVVVCETPVDRGPAGLGGVAVAPGVGVECPADLQTRPTDSFGKVRACSSDERPGVSTLERPLARTAQRPLASPQCKVGPGIVA